MQCVLTQMQFLQQKQKLCVLTQLLLLYELHLKSLTAATAVEEQLPYRVQMQ